jgi:hypothetical protein
MQRRQQKINANAGHTVGGLQLATNELDGTD